MIFYSVTGKYWHGRREVCREDFEGVSMRAVREVRASERLVSGEGWLGKMEMLMDEELWREIGVEMMR